MGTREEQKQNVFGQAFPVRFLLISTVTQQLTFLHFYKLNSVIKTLLFLDLSLDNRVGFQADIKSLQKWKINVFIKSILKSLVILAI